MSRWPLVSFAALALTTLTPATLAHADDRPRAALAIVGAGGETWDAILREIQDSPATLGRTYRLGVKVGGAKSPCGDYVLSFDVGPAALEVGACDPGTGMTRVRVVSREPLFDTSDLLPVPRRVAAHAVLTQHADAEGGGKTPEGGSRVGCSVHLEPYLWDSLHGRAVPLSYDRYELEPLLEDVHAAPDGVGWVARGESRMSVRFRYRMIDRVTGKSVLENEATLACEDKPTTAAATETPDLGGLQRRIDEARAEVAETDRLISALERPGQRPDSTALTPRPSSSSGLPSGVFIAGAVLTFAGALTTVEVGEFTGPGHASPPGATWVPTEVAGVTTAGLGVTTAVIGIFFTRWRTRVIPSVASLPGGGAFSLVGTF